jgi:hypothetical protein
MPLMARIDHTVFGLEHTVWNHCAAAGDSGPIGSSRPPKADDGHNHPGGPHNPPAASRLPKSLGNAWICRHAMFCAGRAAMSAPATVRTALVEHLKELHLPAER